MVRSIELIDKIMIKRKCLFFYFSQTGLYPRGLIALLFLVSEDDILGKSIIVYYNLTDMA